MRTSPQVRPVYSINNGKKKINPQPPFQRGAVWSLEKKQLLLDTIMRGYDIPKFYLRVTEGEFEYEVVDGQQRLRAIWSFINNEFPLGQNSIDFDDLPDLVGSFYSDLTGAQQDNVLSFTLSITEISNATDIEIRELFLRLQEGSTLSPPEKRNAMVGNMRDFVNELGKFPILLKTTMRNDRFQHDDLVAHICKLYCSGGPTNVKASDLKTFYQQNEAFALDSSDATAIKKTLNFLNKAFDDNTPELKIKWGFVDLFLLAWHLLDNYAFGKRHKDLNDFYLGFEQERRDVNDPADLIVSGDPWKKDLYEYINAFQREGATRGNIEVRHAVYLKKFLDDYPDLTPKDPRRAFNENERLVLWRRAGMKCEAEKCGKSIEINEMDADHIIPFSQGGQTNILNGQCLCRDCNQQKSNTV